MILVTHNLPLVGKLAGLIVSISSSGVATIRETVEEAIAEDPALKSLVIEEEEKEIHAIDEVKEGKTPSSSGKLVANEEVALGHVSAATSTSTSGQWPMLFTNLNSVFKYLRTMGGPAFWFSYLAAKSCIDLIEM